MSSPDSWGKDARTFHTTTPPRASPSTTSTVSTRAGHRSGRGIQAYGRNLNTDLLSDMSQQVWQDSG
ncbi:hypothetical protein Pta02_09560 [Planobispora takensis]|uniref:Uncharacterized protein n=1 Tax=Planobispora takensis TaxID=1367882 RepID=A0A8J3SRI6_9ACTN|nr:hypothetical protein Pta02_09560 [Planobispora takensis]